MKIKFMISILFAICTFNLAHAADYYIDITNKTGYDIYYIHISPEASTSWEEDVLGKEVLLDNQTKRINLLGYKSPIFDIRIIDEYDDTYTFWGIDVSTQDLIVTLDDLD